MSVIYYFAAKSDPENSALWLPYETHARDAAEVIRMLYHKWLPESSRSFLAARLFPASDPDTAMESSCAFCRLIALLHDIGKLTPAFQRKIAGSIAGHEERLGAAGMELPLLPEASKSPHQLAGQMILEQYGFSRSVCEIIGAHHGKANACDPEEQLILYPENYYGKKSRQKAAWQQVWKDWVSDTLQETGFQDADSLPCPDVRVQMLLTGLLIMADWIASNTEYFPYIPAGETLDASASKERSKRAWIILGLPPVLSILDVDFEDRFGFAPNSVQEQVMQLIQQSYSPGLLILEAPMGLGKTEAALAAAELLIKEHGAGGVYFGLPTQATANGIFGRIKEWAGKCDPERHSIRLAHGAAELNTEYRSIFHGTAQDSGDENIIVHEWFEGRKQAMLSDFVIATVDQFLLASLKQKHVMLRHLGLSGKVVILDECHAYDAYMNVYLDRTLAWMGAYGVPVIVLSATLPPQRRNALVKAYLNRAEPITLVKGYTYPVLTWTDGGEICQKALPFDRKEKVIRVMHMPENDLAAELQSRLGDTGCAAVIVNTVAYAQDLARALRNALPEFEIICIHSRFIATDRAGIERELLMRAGKHSTAKQRSRLIVVGTQVLEQSLDLDFDFMVTELCPMDLLLQRAGRLHRHTRERPEACAQAALAILEPTEPSKHSIYEPWLLEQTAAALPETLRFPSDIPVLVSKVYEAEDNTSEAFRSYQMHIQSKEENAKKFCIQSSKLSSRRIKRLSQILDDDAGNSEAAERSVRDGEETIEVLVLRQDSDMQYSLASGGAAFDPMLRLDEQEALLIAKERLRLPLQFSSAWNFEDTIKGLSKIPDRWQESRWLKGELLLLLNDALETELIGRKLRYSTELGLEISTTEKG